MQVIGTIFDNGRELRVLESHRHGGQISYDVLDEGGKPYGELSTHVPGLDLGTGEFLVYEWASSGALIESARASGLFHDTGKRIAMATSQAEVWRRPELH